MRIVDGVNGGIIVAVTPGWWAIIAVAAPVVPAAATPVVPAATAAIVIINEVVVATPVIPAAAIPGIVPAVPAITPTPASVEGTPTVPAIPPAPAIPIVPRAVAIVDQHGHAGVDEWIVIIKVGVDGVKITESVVRPVKTTDAGGIVVVIILVVIVVVVVIAAAITCRIVVVIFLVVVAGSDGIIGRLSSVSANGRVIRTGIPVGVVVQIIVLTQSDIAES